jgi:hypothetical protein
MSTVRDIIDAIKHRLPDRVNLYPALNNAVRLISKRLYYHKASMIQEEFSITVAADTSSKALPSDYWGLITKPYVSGLTYNLEPLPNQETKLQYQTDGTPIYYQVKGQTLHFIPGTTAEITVKADYFKKETALTKPSDTMPFFEMFDDAIQEELIHYYMTGDSTGDPNTVVMMGNFIRKAVDEIVPYIDKIAPKRFDDAMNLDGITNEEWWYNG